MAIVDITESANDTNGDGLLNTWGVCKWGTDPTKVDTDGDGIGDRKGAVDTDGDGIGDFGGDTLTTAKMALHILPCK